MIRLDFYNTLVMIQSGGMFTHLDIPKVCSHTREVEFDSLQDHVLRGIPVIDDKIAFEYNTI